VARLRDGVEKFSTSPAVAGTPQEENRKNSKKNFFMLKYLHGEK